MTRSSDERVALSSFRSVGGIIGVFRQGAKEESRQVFLKGLDPERKYEIRIAPGRKQLLTASGMELMEDGFRVEILQLYDGNIYEIASD